MPYTASAERRARSSERKHLHNRAIKSKLKTMQKNLEQLVETGKKEDALRALKAASSALDKAAKSGVIHRATASRKKSRLAKRLAALK